MKIKFTRRNEKGLHCRFCHATYLENDLYETSPIRGIICSQCSYHLRDYLKADAKKDGQNVPQTEDINFVSRSMGDKDIPSQVLQEEGV